MGYVTLGMAALALHADPHYYAFGLNGAVFMMLAHGLTATGLFFVVGLVYERTGTRDLRELGGLGGPMPRLFVVALVLFFASMGLPGLCGFVAEVFVLLAAFHYNPILGAWTAFAVVLTAAYMLWAFRRVFQRPLSAVDGVCFADLTIREGLIVTPLVLLTILLGVYPRMVLDWTGPSVAAVARQIVEAPGNRREGLVRSVTPEPVRFRLGLRQPSRPDTLPPPDAGSVSPLVSENHR